MSTKTKLTLRVQRCVFDKYAVLASMRGVKPINRANMMQQCHNITICKYLKYYQIGIFIILKMYKYVTRGISLHMNRFTCNVLLNMRLKMQISSAGARIERWHGCALKLRRLTSFKGTIQAVERSQYSATHLQTKGKDLRLNRDCII